MLFPKELTGLPLLAVLGVRVKKPVFKLEENTVAIVLSSTAYALADYEDLPLLVKYVWMKHSSGYVMGSYPGCAQPEYMHQVVLGKAGAGLCIDHINRNRLDNRKTNLREVQYSLNIRNSSRVENASGVSLCQITKRYRARLRHAGLHIWLGRFDTFAEAAAAVKAKKKELGL